MKVVCSKENLEKSLKTVRSAVPTRTTLDILRTVLLETEENYLKITANDTTLGIETKIDALVMESGTIAIDAATLFPIVQALPNTDVIIETGYNFEISIRADEAFYQIPGNDPNQFIQLPVISPEGEVVVSQYTVRDMIEKVIFSIADNNLNAAMSGVYLEVLGDLVDRGRHPGGVHEILHELQHVFLFFRQTFHNVSPSCCMVVILAFDPIGFRPPCFPGDNIGCETTGVNGMEVRKRGKNPKKVYFFRVVY